MIRIVRSQPLLSMTKRTASAAFPLEPSSDPVPTALSLYVVLSPSQFNQLERDQPITSDPYSERFGLPKDRLKATNWTPPHASGDAPEPWANPPETVPPVQDRDNTLRIHDAL